MNERSNCAVKLSRLVCLRHFWLASSPRPAWLSQTFLHASVELHTTSCILQAVQHFHSGYHRLVRIHGNTCPGETSTLSQSKGRAPAPIVSHDISKPITWSCHVSVGGSRVRVRGGESWVAMTTTTGMTPQRATLGLKTLSITI